MSRADDLVPLVFPPPSDELGFRQGLVITFNSDTGENVIDVGGTQLIDIPMLNSGEAVALKAGHVVALLTWKSSWWILGRVTIPGSPQFASASVAFGGARAVAFEVGHNAGLPPDDKVTDTIAVPSWADEAIVMCTADITADNTSAQNDDGLWVSARIDSITGEEMFASVNSNEQKQISASLESLRINLSAVTTIEVAARTRTNIATWSGAGSLNRAAISAIAVFRSTS